MPRRAKKALSRAFPAGALVPREDLVGREPILADLFERVYQQRNSVVLSAPRQTGKTSVVEELLRRVREQDGWGISIDCSVPVDLDDLAQVIASATYDQASGSRGGFQRLGDLLRNVPRPTFFQSDVNLAVTFHSERGGTTTTRLHAALQLADQLAAERDRRAVVVYDEFPRLRRLSPNVFDQIRAALQRANSRTSYIFMGSEVGMLKELFQARRRMLFRLGTSIELPPPTKDEWLVYMRRRFRELGQPLESGEGGQLYDFVGGHPRDLMDLCQNLLTLRKLSAPTGQADVVAAEERTYTALRRHFEDVWNGLDAPDGARSVARSIAHGRGVYAGKHLPVRQVKRALDALEKEGIIKKLARGRYEFTEPLFGKFIREGGGA